MSKTLTFEEVDDIIESKSAQRALIKILEQEIDQMGQNVLRLESDSQELLIKKAEYDGARSLLAKFKRRLEQIK